MLHRRREPTEIDAGQTTVPAGMLKVLETHLWIGSSTLMESGCIV